MQLIEQLNKEVKLGTNLVETYYNAVKQRKHLSSCDKAIYKLSLKVWLGFDGESKARTDLIEWENKRHKRTIKILSSLSVDKDAL